MAKHVFKLPDVGEGVVEGEIVKWNVKPGDTVKEDEPLVELMTDKATVAIPSTVNGKVVSTTGKPGDMIPVGSELIVFDVDGDSSPEPEPESGCTFAALQPAMLWTLASQSHLSHLNSKRTTMSDIVVRFRIQQCHAMPPCHALTMRHIPTAWTDDPNYMGLTKLSRRLRTMIDGDRDDDYDTDDGRWCDDR